MNIYLEFPLLSPTSIPYMGENYKGGDIKVETDSRISQLK